MDLTSAIGADHAYATHYVKDGNGTLHLVLIRRGGQRLVARLPVSALYGMIRAGRYTRRELDPDPDINRDTVVDFVQRDLVPSRWLRVATKEDNEK